MGGIFIFDAILVNGNSIDGSVLLKTDGNNGLEHAHLKHIPSGTPLSMGEHLEQNSQMELVGHSIVRALSLFLHNNPTLPSPQESALFE